jgi:uncharacterized membrane protein YbhN (UPF0104 family)
MPFTRWGRHPYLTPPALWTFVISVALALIAVAATYLHLTQLRGINGFMLLLIAYLVLVAGVLFPGI